VQNLIPLDRWTTRPVEGQLTVTIGKFYRVTGESTQHRGVEPDIVLPSSIDMEEVGESALEAALPWDRIAPASFRRVSVSNQTPSAAALEKSEAARAASDPDYKWLVNSIAVNERLRGQTTLSLNLAERKAEREKLDAERLQRENDRRKALGKKPFANLEELEKSDEVTGATTLAVYTYAGDVNFDGLVDASDYGIIDNYFQFPGTTGYANGDFNYDGVIDAGDYGIIDNTFQLQGAPIPMAGVADAGAGLSGVTAVPEPASLSMLALGAAGLLGHRRRSR
jgi:hypothetical protein